MTREQHLLRCHKRLHGVTFLSPYWLRLQQEITSSAQIDPNLFWRPAWPPHTVVMWWRTSSEGAANLIWVKYGAQSVPISSDLINPNHVTVWQRGFFVRKPHCQIIVPLFHWAQSKVEEEGRLSIRRDKSLRLPLMCDIDSMGPLTKF